MGTHRIRLLQRLILCGAAACLLGAIATNARSAASSTLGPEYYLSLGDSWAVGFQNGVAGGTETLHGYSNLVVSDVKAKRHLILENFGCNGAMTSDLLNVVGCTTGGVALDAVSYPTQTQLEAALDFIRAHPHRIGLITISIGNNDYSDNVPLPTITANIETIVRRLRGAVGGSVPIIGLGMDDQSLNEWLTGGAGVASAASSVQAIEYSVNPAIEAGYINEGATFVDVGKVFDTYVPFSTLTDDPPYGEIPVAVSGICRLTSMCADGNPHPNYAGYAVIASQIAKAYLTQLRHP
jgi:lysophospholipase L1-like esterase